VDVVQRSGAFWAFAQLRRGVLLQATERLADYVADRVRAVKEALWPILYQAETNFPRLPGETTGLRIAWDNGDNGPYDYGTLQDRVDRWHQGQA
jgi:hypothetical protein